MLASKHATLQQTALFPAISGLKHLLKQQTAVQSLAVAILLHVQADVTGERAGCNVEARQISDLQTEDEDLRPSFLR